MKIVIPGGSGQVGRVLAAHLHDAGHEVTVLSWQPGNSVWRTVIWNGCDAGDWRHEIEGADLLINLAGRSVNCGRGAPAGDLDGRRHYHHLPPRRRQSHGRGHRRTGRQ